METTQNQSNFSESGLKGTTNGNQNTRPTNPTGKTLYSTTVAEKAKCCMDLLAKVMQHSLEQKTKALRDSIAKEHAEESLRLSEQRLAIIEGERKPELAKILDLANDVQRAKQESELRQELMEKNESLKLELDCAREEMERIRERYRETLVSSTKSAMQTSHLTEELEAARQQAAKAERNAVKEARKASQALEEKETLSKRCEQLEKQVSLVRSSQPANPAPRTGAMASQPAFRVRPVDEPGKRVRASQSQAASKKPKNVRPSTSMSSVFDEVNEQEYGEFDFH